LVSIKSAHEVDLMRRAGDILARCFIAVEPMVADGAMTRDIDLFVASFFRREGSTPSFLGVEGTVRGAKPYPASVCVSINEEVIHGIPGGRRIKNGDLVSLDMGVIYKGYQSDMARTYCVGDVPESGRRLARAAEECFWRGVEAAVAGGRVSDISRRIQERAESEGFSVVRDYTGHGIGSEMHEAPQVPNYCAARERGARLRQGMTLAVEPMVNAGGWEVEVLPDKWTVVTRDRSLSAHYENTVLICDGEARVLSAPA
jgi:methionyl aminopeptidase